MTHLFDSTTGRLLATFDVTDPPDFTTDGRYAIQRFHARAKRLRLLPLDEVGGPPRELPALPTRESPVAITHDGRTLVTFRPGETRSEISLWNMPTGQPLFTLDPDFRQSLDRAVFSPDDSQLVALGTEDNQWVLKSWYVGPREAAERPWIIPLTIEALRRLLSFHRPQWPQHRSTFLDGSSCPTKQMPLIQAPFN